MSKYNERFQQQNSYMSLNPVYQYDELIYQIPSYMHDNSASCYKRHGSW